MKPKSNPTLFGSTQFIYLSDHDGNRMTISTGTGGTGGSLMGNLFTPIRFKMDIDKIGLLNKLRDVVNALTPEIVQYASSTIFTRSIKPMDAEFAKIKFVEGEIIRPIVVCWMSDILVSYDIGESKVLKRSFDIDVSRLYYPSTTGPFATHNIHPKVWLISPLKYPVFSGISLGDEPCYRWDVGFLVPIQPSPKKGKENT